MQYLADVPTRIGNGELNEVMFNSPNGTHNIPRPRLWRCRQVGWLLFVLSTICGRHKLSAVEATWEYAVQISASISASPPQITLNWLLDTYTAANQYIIYRKERDATSWGNGVTLLGSATTYVDNEVQVGVGYEYQIRKINPTVHGYGYIYAGIEIPLREHRGKTILVVDQTYAADLDTELHQLEQDLTGDGWEVARLDLPRNIDVSTLRSSIQSLYFADTVQVKAVFLLGHLRVPYSGNINPDDHADHRGAWPADVFYAEMDGNWTDSVVNNTTSTEPRIRNVPGDGKFDQSFVPGFAELQIGRVDLSNMPGRKTWDGEPTFPGETELLRRYLNKNHAFRHKQFTVPARGLIYDGFGTYNNQAFAASGWRNFVPFFGANNLTVVGKAQWLAVLRDNGYLWAYGCGAGTYNYMAGVGSRGTDRYATTTDIVEADPRSVFVMVNGSWFGDWDHEDNFMRAFLATPGYGLACAWAGSPHWYLHHMALGETIGFGTLLTQNNRRDGLYQNHTNLAAGQVHVALMGDPTLRMHPVAPISNLTGSSDTSGVVNLEWTASPDSVLGYHVYRSSNALGRFTRLSTSLVNGTSFSDATPTIGTNTYMVRAIKLEISASGSYYNPSQGIFLTLNVPPPSQPTVTVVAADPDASHVGPDSATLLFTCSRNVVNDLVVEYTLEGTATKLVDYSRAEGDMPESIVISSGTNSSCLLIHPQPSTNIVETKIVILTLKTNQNYLVGSPARATVNIAGNTVVGGIMREDRSNIRLSWQSSSNACYHIAYKDDLIDPTWKDLGVEIRGTNSLTTWTEPILAQRYYRILQSR